MSVLTIWRGLIVVVGVFNTALIWRLFIARHDREKYLSRARLVKDPLYGLALAMSNLFIVIVVIGESGDSLSWIVPLASFCVGTTMTGCLSVIKPVLPTFLGRRKGADDG